MARGFFERWADPRAIDGLRESYARYDSDEVRRALFATMDAFERFERETAERLGFSPPSGRDPVRPGRAVLALIGQTINDPGVHGFSFLRLARPLSRRAFTGELQPRSPEHESPVGQR